MKRKKTLLMSGAVALLLAGGAWIYQRNSGKLHFQTAAVERGDIQSTISATGNSNAVVTVQVGSQVSGNIKALYADFNTKVKKGQLVALIDPQLFQARVDQARANLESARAEVVNAQANQAKVKADIASAQAAVATAKANVVKAKSATQDAKIKWDRKLELFNEKILSQDDRDTAKATYDQAVAAEDAAQAQVDAAAHQMQSMQAQYDVAVTQLSSAVAQVKQNQAALEQAQVDLDHTQITAPVDGTVIARQMDVGQTVAASFQAPTIFVIAQDLTKMQVDTNVDEADIGKVKLGETAMFTVDAFPGTRFRGTVSQIRQSPINTQNVITYDVVIAVPNAELKLLPGMTANVRVLVDKKQNVLKIPNSALRYRPSEALLKTDSPVHAAAPNRRGEQQPVVWLLGSDGKPRSIRVQLGISDGSFTAVNSADLREGDQVIIGDFSGKPAKAAPGFGGGQRMRGPGF
jgi:HlyD family secretion protein